VPPAPVQAAKQEPEDIMKAGFSFIVCILDRSGSMHAVQSDAIGGFNAFLAQRQADPGEALMTLVLFNDRIDVACNAIPPRDVAPLDESSYLPAGCTALLDAIGSTIDDMGKRLAAMPEDERPEKVIVAILTDGQENASREYSLDVVSQMIARQRDVYKWEFLFLAANQDAIATAATMSIPASDTHRYMATRHGTSEAFRLMSEEIKRRLGES
jgi:hypothetical protein